MLLTLAFTVTDFAGGYGDGATPVPIPNTAVKPICADGTARATGWESRTLPAIFCKTLRDIPEGFLLLPSKTRPATDVPRFAAKHFEA